LRESDVLKRFIESGVLPGIWFLEVPVGFEIAYKKAMAERAEWREFEFNKVLDLYSVMTKRIDAVCIRAYQNAIKPRIPLRYWLEMYRNPRLNPFFGRKVWLIEAKPRLMSDQAFAAIGQLIYYEHHFERDWKGVVEAKAIVYGDGMDEVTAEVVKAIKAKLGIITWHVSEEGRVTLIDGEETPTG